MKFSDLFKDKYNNKIIREYIEQIVRDMTELKRENYHDQNRIDSRNTKIKEFEDALTELGIPFKENYEEGDEYNFEDDCE